MKRFFVVTLLSVLCSSCATIINGSHERVPFRTNPEGAIVRASDGQSCQTPCHLNLRRGRDYTVYILKKGFMKQTVQLDGRSIDGWFFGNILIGGIIGVAVDMGTGSGYDFSPEQVDIQLTGEDPSRAIASEDEKMY